MSKIHFNLICLGLLLLFLGRSVAQQVTANSGGTLQNTSGTLTFTLGELVIDTKTSANGIITQGFHQTMLTVTDINDIYKNNIKVVAYPNPTKNKVTMCIEKCKPREYSYSLYDNSGKLLMNGFIENNETEISFQAFAPELYFLKIQHAGKEIKTIKILKQ